MSNEEKKKLMNRVKKEFVDCMDDIDPKYMKLIDGNFWEQLLCNTDSFIEDNGQRKLTRFN